MPKRQGPRNPQAKPAKRPCFGMTLRSSTTDRSPSSPTAEPGGSEDHLGMTLRSSTTGRSPSSPTAEPGGSEDHLDSCQQQLARAQDCLRSSLRQPASALHHLRTAAALATTSQESALQQHLHQPSQEQHCLPTAVQPARRRRTELLNIARDADVATFDERTLPEEMTTLHCGSLFATKCQHCNALRWPAELASFCCAKGTVVLDNAQPPPSTLRMMHNDTVYRESYLKHTRAYNNALALASLGCKEPPTSGFNPTFKIQGKLYHCIGSLLPVDGAIPKFAQLYFHDSENEVQNRLNHAPHLNAPILHQLQDMLHEVNSYIQSFRAAAELTAQQNVQVVLHGDKRLKPSGEHCRKYNLPMQSEVAALVPGETSSNLDVIVHARDGRLQRIPITHRSYDPLHYVLLFPFGEDGWQLGLKRTNNRTLTASDFYCYRLQVRDGEFNLLMKSRRLMQQYAVDEWARIEFCRMQWVRNNQKAIRAEKYKGLHDAVVEGDAVNAGRRIILPPTIYGSPRFYSEAFMNAMTIVRHMGKPDYFITITTNPRWPEIVEALHDGERPQDRPDLCARVFKLKLGTLMEDLLKKHILGHVQAYVYTIEWQKRGLTHCHILLIIRTQHVRSKYTVATYM